MHWLQIALRLIGLVCLFEGSERIDHNPSLPTHWIQVVACSVIEVDYSLILAKKANFAAVPKTPIISSLMAIAPPESFG